jgi:hypothetical protein
MLVDSERLAAGWRVALAATLLSGACAGTDERLLAGSPPPGSRAEDAAFPQEGRAEAGEDAAREDTSPPPADASTDAVSAPLIATVTVDLAAPRRPVPPRAFGLHASVYDNGLHDPAVPALLAFLDAMKAVDPAIKVGAVLNTPPTD